MNDEQLIKRLADEYELPVEQVALIWSVLGWYDVDFDRSGLYLYTKRFIEETMS